MNDTKPDRNPITHKIHRKEVFWQITFPLILGILLIASLAAWTIMAAINGCCVRKAADFSLVFLILPAMVLSLFPLTIFTGLAYAVIWLNKNTPPYMRQTQDVMIQVRDGVRKGSDKLVEPILRFKSTIASLEALKRKK